MRRGADADACAPAVSAVIAATATRERRSTNPPSARGSGLGGRRSSDSGLPFAPPSQPKPVALRRESVSPHSGGGVPDLHRVPFPLAGFWGGPIICPCRRLVWAGFGGPSSPWRRASLPSLLSPGSRVAVGGVARGSS